MNKVFGLGAMLAMLVVAPAMNASSIYNLTVNGCSGTGGCGTGPFGTITLTDNGSGTSATVTVTLTLAAGERFAGTGAGDALEFNVAGPITITGISTGFGVGPAPDTASTFGTFLASVTCTACTGGQAGNPPGPLSFTVGSATGVTSASFTGNTGGYFFASDIVGANGNTGNVGALHGTSSVPEPTTLSLLGAGLLGLGFIRSRVRK